MHGSPGHELSFRHLTFGAGHMAALVDTCADAIRRGTSDDLHDALQQARGLRPDNTFT
jgi:hypothetical protein